MSLLASSSACEASGAAAGADIRYTEYGIAHVRAPERQSLGVGVGYAQARDNLCQIEAGMLTLDGQLSRYFGPDGHDGRWAMGAENNLESDLYFQGLKARRSVDRLLAEPPPIGPSLAVRELVRGYVDGFNAALAEGPLAECDGAEWLRPMTEVDVYRRAYAVATYMGQGIAAGAIASALAPQASVEVLGSVEVAQPTSTRALAPASGPAPGSNAVALGAEVTASGGGINVANPHLPWDGALRWWQSQLTIEGELDVSGAAVIGLPVIVMGHTESVAWSITTAEETQHYNLFELQLADGAPTTYLVDGEPEAMDRLDVVVEVRRPDGAIDVVTQAQWWTRYGPVLGPRFGLPWTAGLAGEGRAYAFADPNARNLRMLDLLSSFDSAQGIDDILGALRRHQAAPWWTVIAADAAGQALFSQLQVVANVSDEQVERCVSPMWQGLNETERLMILDGSRSDCAWGSDEDAIEPGILGPGAPGAEQQPVLVTRGYVANSNGSHWLPSARERIEGKPGILGPERAILSPRTQQTFVEIEEQLARAPFTREDMQGIMLSHRSRAAELALEDTLALCESTDQGPIAGAIVSVITGTATSDLGELELREACAALAAWDRRMDVDSRGALLFDRYWRRLTHLAGETGVTLWLTPFDVDDPIDTPRQLDLGQPIVARALADAALELTTSMIPLDAALGDYQYVVRGGERIPVGGGGGPDGLLGVFDIFNAEWDPSSGYTGAIDGSTYMHVVSFNGTPCPDSVTLLTYSQSDDPLSPHHVDQTRLYGRKEWVRERFCEQDVLRSPVLEVVHVDAP